MVTPVSRRTIDLFNIVGKGKGLTWKGDTLPNGIPDESELESTQAFKTESQWKKLTKSERESLLRQTSRTIFAEIEKIRIVSTTEAIKPKYLKPYKFEYAPHELPKAVQEALPKFEEIAQLTEELRLLQLDPSGTELWENARKKGGNSLTLFERGYEGGCHRYIEDPFCDSVDSFPDLDPNSTLWPMDIKTGDDIKRLASHPQKTMLMSPFTVVENKPGQEKLPLEKREFDIKTFAQHPLFQSRLNRIATLFTDIATPEFTAEEPEMADTAKAYAQAIRKGKGPRPFDEAEITWAKARGNHIAFTWGPFEESQDPHGIKRTFQFHLFTVRQKESADLEKYQKAVLQDMENRLAKRVEGYTARNVSVPSVIQVYDVIARSGGMNNPHSEFLAEVIPNTGPVVDGGFRKKQIFANLNEGTYEHVLSKLVAQGLDPSQTGQVEGRFLTLNSTLHELSHSIGPLVDSKVRKDGKEMTAQSAMGPSFYEGIEESKANVGGIWMYQLLREKGLITREEENKGYTTYAAGLMRSIRFGSKSPHGRGAKAEFGYLFKVGAIEIRDVVDFAGGSSPFIHVNVDKMAKAMKDLTVEIATAQHLGSEALAKKYFAYAEQIPEAWDKVFVPRFDETPRHIKLEVVKKPAPPPALDFGDQEETQDGNGCGCNLGRRP